MKNAFTEKSKSLIEIVFKGLDHLTDVSKSTILKIEFFVFIEIMQILYFIFEPNVSLHTKITITM